MVFGLAAAANAEDDNSVPETPHFVTVTKYMSISDAEREAYIMGAFDAFLVGLAAGKKGWSIDDWLKPCFASLTSGKLMAKADDRTRSGTVVIDGKPFNDRISGASNLYSALHAFCHPGE